jgi:tetratricopeptide (TPR) repeat protein
MQDPWSTVVSDTQLHPEYVEGRRFLRQGNLAAALACFKAANQSTVDSHIHASLYLSYLGLTQVMLNDVSGLNLCRRAAQEEAHRGDVFENLARAELRMGHRKQACEALRRGLKVESGHTGLRELRTEMGVRRPPALGFLDRDNPLNRFLGRLTYRPRRKRTTGR